MFAANTPIKKIAEKSPGDRLRGMAPVLALAFVLILFAVVTGGQSLEPGNLKIVILQAMILMVSAMGAVFVMAGGNFDLSLGGVIGISSVIGFQLGGGDILQTVVMCILAGLAVGSFVGFVVTILNVPSLFVGIVMMGVGKSVAGMAVQDVQMTTPIRFMELDELWFYALIAIIVSVVVYFLLNHSKVGIYNKSIGANRVAAFLSGIKLNKYQMIAYMITGICSGLAAFLRMLRLGAVTSTTGVGVELDVMLSLVVGGIAISGGSTTKIRSVVIGVLLMQILSNGLVMAGVHLNLINIVKGLVFILATWLSYDRKRGATLT